MKRLGIFVIFLLCALLLSGCVPLAINMQRADEQISLPAPGAPAVEAAQGDVLITSNRAATLYVVSDDQQLAAVERVISFDAGESPITRIVRTLLNMEAPVGAMLPFPDGTRLLNVEYSEGTAVIELSIEARNISSEQQFLWMRSVIAASLLELQEVEHVNVLIAGRNEGILNLPAGAISVVQKDLSSAWARLSAERDLLLADESGSAAIDRTAILYYPTRDGKYISPAARTVRISDEDMITPLIQALMSPAANLSECLRSPFPQDSQVLNTPPEILYTEDGEKLVRLSFDANLMAMLEREGLSAWQLCASLTHTITGFVPDVDGLIITLGDGLLTRTERGSETVHFIDGRMDRQSYPDAVCSLCAVYMGSADGGLIRVMRPQLLPSAQLPRAHLRLLFDGPMSWENGALRVMPDGASADDILGVRISGSEAVVNFSSNFYRCCQALTPQQERALIYAVVNTLTEQPNVTAVRFQVEGEPVDYLVNSIFLRNVLMRNVGIIRNPEQ